MMKTILAPAILLALAGLAQAQAGGGFGSGMRDRERIPWFNSLEKVGSGTDNLSQNEKRRLKAMGIDPTDKKYIFVYIRPVTEETEPREFVNCTDALDAVRGPWAFVKLDFDKENSYQKSWGVKTPSVCIGCDLFSNAFIKVGGPSVDNIRTVIRNTPGEIAKYEAKLKYDFQKANDTVKTDEEKAAKLFVDICLAGKNGYKEVTESQTKLNELTDSAFRKGELATAVSPEAGVEYYEDLVKIYRSTAPGAKAEIVLALLEHARGNVQPAILRLLAVMKYDARLLKAEIEAAAKALEEISKAGDAKIDGALSGADKAVAKEILRKLAKDYAGTEAGKHAADASK
jgi:hypothetical protein